MEMGELGRIDLLTRQFHLRQQVPEPYLVELERNVSSLPLATGANLFSHIG
jgi:hypothetical protein